MYRSAFMPIESCRFPTCTTILLFLIFFLVFQKTTAQEGELYISNFSPYEDFSGSVWDMAQGYQNQMFFSTRKGVIAFNADEWNFIPTSNLPYALEYDSVSRRLYIGCLNMLGFLETDNYGRYQFKSLYEPNEDIGVIYDIILDGAFIYTISNFAISKVSLTDTSLTREWISTTDDNFQGAFKSGEKLYINITDAGLFQIENDTIWPTINGHKLAGKEIIFAIDLPRDEKLIGTGDNELFIFKNEDFFPFKIDDEEYIQASVLSDGILLNDSAVVISTLIGGSLIIDLNTRKTVHTINYQTGLPDDEIVSLALDANNGMWLSHSKGLSRVDQNFPVHNFDAYPGLEGNILYIATPDDELYVATSEGVYYLKEEKEYNEKIILKKAEQEEIDHIGKKRRRSKNKDSFFSFFKGKKNNKSDSEKAGNKTKKRRFKIFGRTKDKSLQLESEKEETPQYIKEKIYELRSVSHRYKKITEINDKCKQMVVLPDRIVVAANNGLYEIKNKKGRVIVDEKYFHTLAADENNTLVAVADDELYLLFLNDNKWIIEKHKAPVESIQCAYIQTRDSIWLGGYDKIFQAIRARAKDEFSYINHYIPSRFYEPVDIRMINNTLYFFQPSCHYRFEQDTIVSTSEFLPNNGNSGIQIIPNANYTWIKYNQSWESFPMNKDLEQTRIFLNLFTKIKYIHTDSHNNIWLITDNDKLYKIEKPDSAGYKFEELEVYLTHITDGNNDFVNLESSTIGYKENALVFNLSAPFFLKQNATQYTYFVEGLMNDWSRWSHDSKISFPFIPAGDYFLHVKAKNVLGVESKVKTYNFQIQTPFRQTKLFYLLLVLLLGSLVYFFIKYRERNLTKEKEMLSKMVEKRTHEIAKQKEEIEIKNNEITSSIEYAQKIQSAVFPSKEKLDGLLNDYFVFFKPRDIVSGDFYWATKIKNKIVIAAADCTGHGVPGAFMSMLGVSFLNEIVNKDEKLNAAEILNLLRSDVVSTLSQGENGKEARDGIDLALCVFDFQAKTMQFAGAYNPVLLVRNGQIYEYKANRMPVGAFSGPQESFTNHVIDLVPEDKIYLFTDGYADQIGGPEDKKLMIRNFKNLLLEIHKKPMHQQHQTLEKNLINWMGEKPQIDDVLVIGVGV